VIGARQAVPAARSHPWRTAVFYAVLADLDAPTGFRQAFAFAVVVTMRLASLRWRLHTPLPGDLVHKLMPRRHQGDDAPQDTAGDARSPHGRQG
jgi:hypothetical protein